MRKLLAVLLLCVSGAAWAYNATQNWQVGEWPSYTPVAPSYASAADAFAGLAWPVKGFCSSGPPHNVFNTSIGETCASVPSFKIFLVGSTCLAGDTLSADGLTCTTGAPPGGTGGTGGTGYGGDSGTGFAAWLLSWLNAFTAWILTVIASVFVGLWAMLTDLFIFVLDSLFDLVLYIVSGMSWDFTTFNPVTYWNQLPADLVSVLNLIGVPIALGMIVAALGIRFILQLIPFVRWGS